ncbi:hypothetical protein CVT24_009458 [Panaeolus cyanescens]|uniref:Uncharacterized protein n=1 Tax=Panaeolus cyanescens TaxID=181874 RepID=A0A409W3M9_9AGAR|nr:hypothetical protein CVT24_009458 [Panaeolus cyanescens]
MPAPYLSLPPTKYEAGLLRFRFRSHRAHNVRSLGKADLQNDIFDIDTHYLGYDIMKYSRASNHYARELTELDLSTISTRSLVAELADRLEGRDNVATWTKELNQLFKVPRKERDAAYQKKINDLKKKIEDAGCHWHVRNSKKNKANPFNEFGPPSPTDSFMSYMPDDATLPPTSTIRPKLRLELPVTVTGPALTALENELQALFKVPRKDRDQKYWNKINELKRKIKASGGKWHTASSNSPTGSLSRTGSTNGSDELGPVSPAESFWSDRGPGGHSPSRTDDEMWTPPISPVDSYQASFWSRKFS